MDGRDPYSKPALLIATALTLIVVALVIATLLWLTSGIGFSD